MKIYCKLTSAAIFACGAVVASWISLLTCSGNGIAKSAGGPIAFTVEDIELLLGEPLLRMPETTGEGNNPPGKVQLVYRNRGLLVGSAESYRIAGISVLFIEGQLRRVAESYEDTWRGRPSDTIMESAKNARALYDGPVVYFESIRVTGNGRSPEHKRSLLGQILILAYYHTETVDANTAKSLSASCEIVKAFMHAHNIAEDAKKDITDGRIFASALIRLAIRNAKEHRDNGVSNENGVGP